MVSGDTYDGVELCYFHSTLVVTLTVRKSGNVIGKNVVTLTVRSCKRDREDVLLLVI